MIKSLVMTDRSTVCKLSLPCSGMGPWRCRMPSKDGWQQQGCSWWLATTSGQSETLRYYHYITIYLNLYTKNININIISSNSTLTWYFPGLPSLARTESSVGGGGGGSESIETGELRLILVLVVVLEVVEVVEVVEVLSARYVIWTSQR